MVSLQVLAPRLFYHRVIQRVRQELHELCHPSHLPRDNRVARTFPNDIDRSSRERPRIHQKRLTIWDGSRHRSPNIPRANGKHLDAGSSELDPKAFAEGYHCRFRCAVRACTRNASHAGNAGNTHQAPATACLHGREERLECGECSKGVRVQHLAGRKQIERSLQIDGNRDPSASDDHIWYAVAKNEGIRGVRQRGCVSYVGCVDLHDAGAGISRDSGSKLVEYMRSPGNKAQCGATGCVLQGQRFTDARRRASDENLEVHAGLRRSKRRSWPACRLSVAFDATKCTGAVQLIYVGGFFGFIRVTLYTTPSLS
jgi:hypothetical protein